MWPYFVLRLVHVLAMALWVGGPPVAVFGLRRALARDPLAAIERLLAVTPVFVAAALVTVASGATILFGFTGLAAAPPRILAGALLTVPIFVVGATVVRPALQGLQAHFAAGRDADSAEHLVRRFVLAHRLEQALRLTVLALMVLPF